MQSDKRFEFPDNGFVRPKWVHYLHLFLINFAVLSISMVAIFYSLGYQYDWVNHTIRRTGLISMDSGRFSLEASIKVNGDEVADSFPYLSKPTFPGTYTLSVEKEGYQPWERTIDVRANQVTFIRSLVLIRENPLPKSVSNSDKQLFSHTLDARGIVIDQNELYVNGNFVTRTSQDIINAAWFSDHVNVVFQTGQDLWLSEPDGLHTQLLLHVNKPGLINFRFARSGHLLLYEENGVIRGLEIL